MNLFSSFWVSNGLLCLARQVGAYSVIKFLLPTVAMNDINFATNISKDDIIALIKDANLFPTLKI